MTIKLCQCGSGNQRYELRDAAGIFCAFVCSACEATKRAKYNPAIFTSGTAYATSGEELDIGVEVDAEDDFCEPDEREPRDEPESPGWGWDGENGPFKY